MIKNGSLVRFEYTLSDENETYFNRIKGRIRSLIRTDGTSLFKAWRKDSLE